MSKGPAGLPPQLLALQRQMVELQRAAFESSFQAVATIQDRQADVLQGLADQMPAVAPELREALETWTASFRRAREEYHDSAERSYELLDQLFDRLSGEAEGRAHGESDGEAEESRGQEP
ncbi:MAG TPA: hypothetical protein VMT85_13395 [Thermoanaerobaculia bacterium]|nr:hypothetical protein [Thermoanaerobaculia bacterium]